mmetsp:Transcript_25510/g.43386  ORF Transcript_25510/g.43386 Transcript_25510/m.43386 type:complete len:92 (+) Transcript_25510:1118-1393(+)
MTSTSIPVTWTLSCNALIVGGTQCEPKLFALIFEAAVMNISSMIWKRRDFAVRLRQLQPGIHDLMYDWFYQNAFNTSLLGWTAILLRSQDL